jgi:hypothetical protein
MQNHQSTINQPFTHSKLHIKTITHPPASHKYSHPYSLIFAHTPVPFSSSWDSFAHPFPPKPAPQSCISHWA